MEGYIRIVIYLASLMMSFYTLSCVDFSQFLYPRKAQNAQLLLVLLSMALAYLVAQFLMGLTPG